jgi:iron complex outermembrane receptor protein
LLIKNTGQETITDDNGNFEFQKLKPATYIIHVSLLGYNDSDITVQVKANETVFLNIRLHQTYAELKQVIVNANAFSKYTETKVSEGLRLTSPLNEIPKNIAVVTQDALKDEGLMTMSEAIRNVSGVEKVSGGELNDYNLIIRGTNATWNVFRNGVGGYSWNQQEDVAMLEKIELIKGPAGFMVSIAYPSGIVNNVTKQPTKERISNIDVGVGSFNLMRITTDFGGTFDKAKKFSYRFNAGIQQQDRAFQFGKASRYFVCAALKYEINKKTSVTAEYNYMLGKTFGNNDNLPSLNGKLFALPANFAVADANTDALTANDAYYRAQLKHSFNDNWHLNAQIAYVHGTWGGYMLDADGSVPVSNDTLYRVSWFDDFREFSTTGQAYVDGKFHTGKKIIHNILAGIDYCHAGFTDKNGGTWGDQKFGIYLPHPNYDVPTDSLRNLEIIPGTTLHWGWLTLYTQDEIKFGKKLLVTFAGHLVHSPLYFSDPNVPDYQKNTHYNVIIPRLGLTWLGSQNISIYALYDQCFWPQEGQNFTQKPFLPLTGFDEEAGIKGYFNNKRLNLNLSFFNIVQNNTLTADPLHNDYYIQTGQIISKGIDVDITGNIFRALAVNANYEYVDAKITKDSDPKNVGLKNFGTPGNAGNLWFNYQLPYRKLRGLSFAMGYQYMGKRSAVSAAWNWSPGDAINFLPAYNLLNAAVSYRNKRFNIGFNIYNITNSNYASFGYFNSATNEWRYTPGEPINFRLSFGVSLVRYKKD